MQKVKIIFHAVIEEKGINGVIQKRPVIKNMLYYQQHINRFKLGDKVVIEIEKRTVSRSLQQNSFYWGAVLPCIAESTGNITEDLHEFFKRKFLAPREVEVLGKAVVFPGSTAKLSSADFFEYLQKIEHLTGIPLPNPEDAGYGNPYK